MRRMQMMTTEALEHLTVKGNIHSAAKATAMPRLIKEPNLSCRPDHGLRTNLGLGQAWTPHQPETH
jgi:hypothetical protein